MSQVPDNATSVHFVHANGFPFGSYKTLFAALPSEIEVYGKEKLGHDDRFPVNSNWRNLSRELLDHVDSTNAKNEKVYLIGHSFGAVVAYQAACLVPERFAGLIMLDPPLVTGWRRFLVRAIKNTSYINRITPAGLAQSRKQFWTHDENLVNYFAEKDLFKNVDKRCLEDYVRSATETNEKGVRLTFQREIEAEIFRNVADDVHTFRGKIKCPALLITAEDSKVCLPAMRDCFIKQNNISHMSMRGGHLFPLEYPEEVADILTKTIFAWQNNQVDTFNPPTG